VGVGGEDPPGHHNRNAGATATPGEREHAVSWTRNGLTRRVGLWLALAGLCLAVGAAVGWALTVVLTPVDDGLDSDRYTFVSVESGEVGASIQLNTVAEWKPEPAGTNRAVGVVTGVDTDSGDEVGQGSVLYSVDLRPVVVAQGEVPAFRSLTTGTEGADVTQLQQMLAARGHYSGALDGKVGGSTVAAIKRWQQQLGIPATGVVETGDVIFVPILPTRVSLDDAIIFRGATLAGDEEAVNSLPPAPMFSMPVTEAQAMMIPTGSQVEITSPDGTTWVGAAARQITEAATSTITVSLERADGEPICGEQCNQIPVIGQSLLASRVVTAETVNGLVVPSAALVSGAHGQIEVVTEGGRRMRVAVVAAARGMTVIEGVERGLRVRVPGRDR